jgi:Kinesin motor domain
MATSAAATNAGTAAASGSSSGDEDKISVFVRVRPLSQNEHDAKAPLCLRQSGPSNLAFLGPLDDDGRGGGGGNGGAEERAFNFDRIFWGESQSAVFERVGPPVIQNAWRGLNSSVLAYGQTGSGKTHTIMKVSRLLMSGCMCCAALAAAAAATHEILGRVRP